MSELEQAIQQLLDVSTADLVRFAWGPDGTVIQTTLPPMPVFEGRFVVSHLCEVEQDHEIALAHIVMQAMPDPALPQHIFQQGSGVWCETNLPILSTLYWLAKESPAPPSPYEWWFGERRTLQWFFRTIEIPELSASKLLRAELPGLIPLIPFTRDASAEIVTVARRQLPTAASREYAKQLESLLLFFWDYVQVLSPYVRGKSDQR